ncbi:DUF447 domain-containing protein [Methanobrevibacter sp. DSM 116169]|uniref:DUF447 domain-containing protein n=1 Tax=Methanobrevibacter sp. DSM 116169 TaxID=3242727 RepID=UPI0038FC608A
MNINLNDIGIEKGQKYEVILTTENKDKSYNAAPIGIMYKNKDEVICKIFKTSKTLKNIHNTGKFIVNITYDPILFTLATIDTIPQKYYNSENILENVDAYFKCKVLTFKDSISYEDPVKKSEAEIVIAKVEEIVIKNKSVKPINRGMHVLIESLVNYTRLDIVSKKEQEYYLDRLKEAERLITKVGSLKEKEALDILKKEIIKKGYTL